MKRCQFVAVRGFLQLAIAAVALAGIVSPRTVQAQAAPALSIADASTLEGNSGTKALQFAVSLSAAAATTVSVRVTTSNGTAISGSDYSGGSLTVTFAPGETLKVGNVGIRGDVVTEPDETFLVTLSSPTGGASLARAQATGTIINDDGASDTTPDAFSFAPVSNATLGSVQTSDAITVSGINAASPIAVTGGSYSINGGAFVSTAGTVRAGQTVRVQQTASSTANATTTATLTIGGVSAGYAVTTAGPTISINDASIGEGNSGTQQATLTVSLSAASATSVTVAFATADGTATSGSDYTALSGSLTFGAGVTSQTVSIGILGETTFEPDETVLVNLSSPTAATLADGQGAITIVNDDANLPTVSIADASTLEGNSGTKSLQFAVSLSAAAATTVSVRVTTSNGTAISGSDYTGGSLTVTFAPGETLKVGNVGIRGDVVTEPDETFLVTLSSPTGGASLARAQATGTIINDDGASDTTPDAFSFAPVTNAAVGSVQTSDAITVSGINAASPISVTGGSYSINGGAFVTTAGTVTAGQTVRVQQTASSTANATTTATLTIGGVSAGYAVTTAGPTISINDASLSEGNSGTQQATLTVSLSAASATSVTVTYATADGTATSGSDYTALSGSLTFGAGVTSQTVSIGILGETTFEPDETVLVNLSSPMAATLADGQGAITIINDDANLPTVSVNDVSITEGNSGTVVTRLTFRLSAPSSQTVSVRFATANGTATSGSDYVARTGTTTFAPGETSKTQPYTINGDTNSESDETFFVNLNTPVGLAITKGQGVITIVNDDAAADTTPNAFSFAPVTNAVPGSVQTSDAITVSGINAASPISVVGGSYSINGGAFVTTAGTVTLGQTVRVQQTASSTANATSTATLTIGGVSANYVVTTAGPSVSINDASLSEGNSGTQQATLTVSLSAASATSVTVGYATADGTATAGSDYVASSGSLTFGAGVTSQTVSIGVLGDTTFEPDETVLVNLTSVSHATIAKGQGVVTVVNDDATPDTTPDAFSFAPVTNAAVGSVQTSDAITVSGINAASPISVAGGSYSINGGAFVTTAGTVTAGQTVRVQQTASSTANATTTATLTIGGVSAGYAVTTAGPTISINDASLSEGNSGTQQAQLTVTLSAASASDVSVAFTTSDGTASAGSDYVAASGSLMFPAGQTTQMIAINVTGDSAFEPDETAQVTLSAPANAALADSLGVITIVNDDAAVPTFSIADASVVEGNSGSRNMIFVITLSPAATTTTSVRATTTNGTAMSGSDYTGGAASASFAPGETSKSVTLTVRGDTLVEEDETFFATLSAPSAGTVLGRSQATGTIIDDDGDRSPDPFAFQPVIDAAQGSLETSSAVVVSGINTGSPISVVGGSYSINGAPFTAVSGTVNAGQSVRVQQIAANAPSTTSIAALTIGNLVGNFSVTTAAAGDHVPDPFTFAPLTDVALGSMQTSNAITISGIDTSSLISVTGGLYSINGGAYTGSSGTVRAGNVVTVQLLAPFSPSTTGTATLTVGGVSAEFRVTTASVAADSTPDSFAFASRVDVVPGSEQTSDSITVSGINVESPISVVGGSYSINNGPFSSDSSLVRIGDVVAVRVTASTAFSASSQVTLNIGGVQGNFTVTTQAFVADSQPDPLVYVSIFGADRARTYTSLPAQIRGINVPVPISVTGGTYSINGQPRTSAVGSVINGDIVDVQLQSSGDFATTASVMLTVGDVSASYAVETVSADRRPDSFSFQPAFDVSPLNPSTSNAITVTGINTATPITISGGAYRINGGPWTVVSATVLAGDTVEVSSGLSDRESRGAVLSVGEVSASFMTFSSNGLASPQPFSFAPATAFTLLATMSESVTISGLTAPSRVQISGGQYSVNGAPFSAAPGVVRNGDTLRLLVIAGPMIDDIRTAVITAGTYSTAWSVTTQAPVDTIGDQLRFPEVRSAPVNSEFVSPPIPISGVNVRVPISINAPYSYSLNGGPFTGEAGTVVPGDILRVRVLTGPEFGRTYSIDITIGTGTINWPVRTVSSPARPNRFTLEPASAYPGAQVLPGTVQFTKPVVVSNSTGPTAVTVTNGQYSINGGAFTAASGTVNEGDTVVVRFVMPMTFSTSTSVTLRLGNVSSALSVSTVIDPVANTLTTLSGSSASYVIRNDAVVPVRAFVFNPPGWQPTDRRAAYIDWSGGGWARGGQPQSRSRYWATDQGMVVISPDQRVNERFGTYAYVHADDVRLTVRWTQENATQLGIDPTRIVVTGTSSGGGNAVWASLLEPPVTTSSRNNPLARVGAVVLRSGVASTAPDGHLGQSQLDRFGEFVDAISPERGIDPQLPPYLIFHADGDLVFAENANLRLCSTIRSLARVCEFVNIPGLGHDWPNSPGKSEESRTQELDFLQRMGILPSVQTPAP